MLRLPAALPIDPYVPAIRDACRQSRAVVVTAPPGAGKTTRVPPALADDGALILLQPRRVAARAIVQRIAEEREWTVGREVGWQIRFERRFSADTRLLVATEGVLTARLQRDPLLSSFRTIVIDEFHERSIHADLAIALAKQAWLARPELRIVVMSATLDAAAVSAFLGGCPTIVVPGRTYPIEVEYAPGRSVADGAAELVDRTTGDVLCFLAGAFEIRAAISDLQSRIHDPQIELVPLYGALDATEQDKALRGSRDGKRRVIVATNIAETSVTVPGVTAVVDSGLHKVARYDADRGIDSLATERITQDAADQRAGRAGRDAPGKVRRLWDARDRLRPHREPEIHRVDLSGLALDVVGWGGDPRRLDWFDPPRGGMLEASLGLLERIGAVNGGRLTEVGRQMQRLPLHPRLARMLVAARGATPMARACAILSERQLLLPRQASTTCDLLSLLDEWAQMPPHVQRAAREIEQLCVGAAGAGFRPTSDRPLSDENFRRAVLAGYPDRIAQRRAPGSARVKLSSGAGGTVASQSGVREGEFLVAIDVQAPTRSNQIDNIIRLASRVEREWIEPNATEVVHRFDADAGVVRAAEILRYDALTLGERPVSPDAEVAARLLADEWLARGPSDEERQLLERLRFAGHSVDIVAAIRQAAHGIPSIGSLRLAHALSADLQRTLDREAPAGLRVPTGRTVPLRYEADGTVSASVKLQELFGLAETPRIGPRSVPVVFSLLAPNGRPVQVTRDLRSFWERTYPEVRKELRGRYPKHPWPEDPWNAIATARPTRRRN